LSGLILRIHYVSHVDHRFNILIRVLIDIDSGILLRFMHCNGRRLLFFIMYLHIFKGIFYRSYTKNRVTWLSGRIIYLIIIIIAFLGYVLPWGQIRYWGATVIRSLITTIPTLGKWLLIIIWGDYSVRNRTLNRFYTLHFVIPFLLSIFVLLHLLILHSKGSTTIISTNKIITPFRAYFLTKDLVGFIVIFIVLLTNIIYLPNYFIDCENSIIARALITPIHIVPEWYFLYAYCILKRFERKVIGVLILLIRVAFFPLLTTKKGSNDITHKFIIMIWLVNFGLLTKIGAIELSYPYIYLRKFCTIIHFTPLM